MNLKEFMNLKKEDSEEGKFLDFWYYLKTIRPNKTLVIFGALVIAAAAGIFIVLNHVDQNYDVLSTLENEDTQSSEYVQFGEDLLKYGNESVSLLSQSGNWR